MNNTINYLKKKLGPNKDYIYKKINIDDIEINIVFNEVLTSSSEINDYLLQRLTILNKNNLDLENKLPEANIKKINKTEILTYLNNGFVIILIEKTIYTVEVRRSLERGITTIESELSINGPKDSFSEVFNTNLGLIRRRIKSENLWCEQIIIGKHSKTTVGILYMNNICDKNLLNDIKRKLKQINIDGLINSTYLRESLEESNIFPTIMVSERPDKVSMALLEGKIVILTDTTSYALILPNLFIDYFHSVDDYYQKSINITFIRIIRLLAFFIAIFIPAYYIAVTTYNQNAITLPLLLILKAQRISVPFPAIVEVLFMIISFEILRESDLRMSSTTGSAISILGGLILGDAAVNAGIMSPIMIIIIALSSIAGFVFTSVELVNAIRLYRIIFLILASLLGLYGIYLGSIYLLYNLISLNPFNKPYLSPFSPFIKKEMNDAIYKSKNNGKKYRNPIFTKNNYRGEYK